eukprot:3550721-Pyramimonas_sp.AAC.1
MALGRPYLLPPPNDRRDHPVVSGVVLTNQSRGEAAAATRRSKTLACLAADVGKLGVADPVNLAAEIDPRQGPT